MHRFDQESIYCRKLGHHLNFSYCRSERRGKPCRKIIDCWFEKIPIQDFLADFYSPEEIQEILKPPAPKLNYILELIKQSSAKKQTEERE